MPAGDYIKAARLRAGLSQRALAERLGVSQPAISALESGREDATVSRVEQILAALNERFAPIPVWANTAADTAQFVAELMREPKGPFWDSNRLRPIIQLSDDLRAVSDLEATCMIATPPQTTGDRGIDSFIAGVCDMYVVDRQIPRPIWIDWPDRSCSEPWDLEPIESLKEAGRAGTPLALARHNVFVDSSFFASV